MERGGKERERKQRKNSGGISVASCRTYTVQYIFQEPLYKDYNLSRKSNSHCHTLLRGIKVCYLLNTYDIIILCFREDSKMYKNVLLGDIHESCNCGA